MLLKVATCPICEQALHSQSINCPICGCVVQFTPDPPSFARPHVKETLVQPVIDRCRAQIQQNAQDAVAVYLLGLCYLNYELLDQGIEQLRKAATLLPENHVIAFELAVLLHRIGQRETALDYASQAYRQAPDIPNYRYTQQYIVGAIAYARGEVATAIESWIAAYQQEPQWHPAAHALKQFIAAFEPKLTQSIARSLSGLSQQDLENLRILNGNPALQKQTLPRAPRSPGKLGSISMSLLRRVSPKRAEAIEQMHTERIAAYQHAAQLYQIQHQTAMAEHASRLAQWQVQDQAIRQDLAAMARLSLAVFREEERQRFEEERRQAEVERRRQEAEQRRQARQQQRAAAQQQAAAVSQVAVSTPQKPIREKQYLSTKAQYISGLPKGKDKDDVSLVVSNLKITIKHGGMLGAWEYTIPMASLINVSSVTVKHFLSSEKRLQITYRNERGAPADALFSGLKVDESVNAVMKARVGK